MKPDDMPNSPEAEEAVLGAILFDNKSMITALEYIPDASAFHEPGRRKIYSSMIKLFVSGQPIDMITISSDLGKMMESCGGLDYISMIMAQYGTAAMIGAHSKILKELYQKRRIIIASIDIASKARSDGATSMDVLSGSLSSFSKIADSEVRTSIIGPPESAKVASAYIESLASGAESNSSLSTGFNDIDTMTGGLENGDYIIFAGRPSMGKTSIALDVAEFQSVYNNKSVLIFSLETSVKLITMRMVSSLSKIPFHRIKSGKLSDTEWARINDAILAISKSKLYIDDTARLTTLDINLKAKQQKSINGLDMVIIDFLQLISHPGRAENEVIKLQDISRDIKIIAKELGVPFIVISQLSRGVESRDNKRPCMSDLRGSGSLEQDADMVAFIYREEYYKPDNADSRGKAEFIISKQKNGPTGVAKLGFNKELMSFHNLMEDA